MTITKPTEVCAFTGGELDIVGPQRLFTLPSRKAAKAFVRMVRQGYGKKAALRYRLITADKAQGSIRQWPKQDTNKYRHLVGLPPRST